VKHDRHRPESPETQARIQIAAVAKRARKAKAFVRGQELTALGRRLSQELADGDCNGDAIMRAARALRARRAKS
jgi:hypothetical protein